MTRVFHKFTRSLPPTATHGDGVYIYDEQNQQYIDACGGAAVSCLGYNHPALINAIRQQANQLTYIHSSFFTSKPAETLAEKLVATAPTGLNKVVLTSGGSEGMETSLKLARQYFYERGAHDRKYFISRQQSYHGGTFGVLSVGHHTKRRMPFLPLLSEHNTISPCNPYRFQQPKETEKEYGLRVANELEQKILELGPENVIGFVAETVGGSTGGVLPPAQGYFKRIREICNQYDILLILDEVMCGSGRTGSFFAFSQEGITPDLVTLAKGLGAGYQPIAATLCSDPIFSTVDAGSGALIHSFTYMGHTLACTAAVAVMETIENDQLLNNVGRMGMYLINRLKMEFKPNPYVGDVRGRGLFIGVEFVANKKSKESLDPSLKFYSVLKQICFQNGLMIYPSSGTIDGIRGDHAMLSPAYTIDKSIADKIVDRFVSSVNESLEKVGVN